MHRQEIMASVDDGQVELTLACEGDLCRRGWTASAAQMPGFDWLAADTHTLTAIGGLLGGQTADVSIRVLPPRRLKVTGLSGFSQHKSADDTA